MQPIQAVCDKCKKTVDAKPLLSENELWLTLNKGDEIEVMHLGDDPHHTWKLTGERRKIYAMRGLPDNLTRIRESNLGI
jgi:hypothetical protein